MTRHYRKMLAAGLALAATLPGAAAHAQSDNETLVQGYIRFMAYHEAGHLLMNQVQGINPKTAPSDAIEQAADDFATVLLMPDADDETGVSEILGAASAWLRAGPRLSADDPHAPPQERALQIICHVYGSNPESFADFAKIIEEDWNCEQTFADMLDSIDDYYVSQSDESGAAITFVYDTPAPAMANAASFLKDTGILEDLAFDVDQTFKLIRPTTLQGMNCSAHGVHASTFYYDSFPDKNYDRISICYELIDDWLKVDFGAE